MWVLCELRDPSQRPPGSHTPNLDESVGRGSSPQAPSQGDSTLERHCWSSEQLQHSAKHTSRPLASSSGGTASPRSKDQVTLVEAQWVH